MKEQGNLLLAIVLSLLILLGFQYFFEAPKMKKETERKKHLEQTEDLIKNNTNDLEDNITGYLEIDDALNKDQRIKIDATRLQGSISLKGLKIDDLTFKNYKETLNNDSKLVTLFKPSSTRGGYFSNFGWIKASTNEDFDLPNDQTIWTANSKKITSNNPAIFSWANEQGVQFEQEISIDENYMFTIKQKVINNTDKNISISPVAKISRTDTPKTQGFFILHEGPLGVFNGTLQELDYDDLRDNPAETVQSTGGWIGITDKYWLGALIPDQNIPMTGRFYYTNIESREKFQVDYLLEGKPLAPAGRIEFTNRLFAGAKVVTLLDQYESDFGIARFDLAVDFGWFYFLTKPLFYLIHYLTGYLGNIGLAILAVTVIIKLIFFPLANKSYTAMSKLKKLQPEMMKLREQFGDDKVRLNQEMMALYKREGANPLAGCLPIVIQIPVFFALYKVLFVTIEMRHAPFYGWIEDLSAPDPTSIFNLFGLLPYIPPDFLAIGVWPLAMGFTMWLQQKLNPTPPDPTQARIMMLLPVVFTFLFARFAAGLVIYWTWNNILSILQQWVIMRRMGVRA